MPSSAPHIIGKVIDILLSLQPHSILDVGSGFGKYGMLAREYLDYEKYPHFERKIDGIEAFPSYVTDIHHFSYSKMRIGPVNDVLASLTDKYEMALVIDVLPDLTKADTIKLVESLKARSDAILITLPKVCWNEKAEFDNPYEIFRSDWTKSEIKALGGKDAMLIWDWSHWILFIAPRQKRSLLRKRLFRKTAKKFLYSLPFATAIRRQKTAFSNERARELEREWQRSQDKRKSPLKSS